MKHRIFIMQFSDDLAYLEEFIYETHEERYEKTKDIPLYRIFESSELDEALEIIYQINKF